MVIVDECHHMLQPGPGKDIRIAIQSLKHMLQSDHGVALVIAGVPALRDAILSEKSGEAFRRCRVYQLAKIRPRTNSARPFETSFLKSVEKLGLTVRADGVFAERKMMAEHVQVGRSITLAKEILRDAVIRKREELSLEHAGRIFRKINQNMEMTPFHPAPWDSVKGELEAIGWIK